jgi:hypothetical protein
MLFSRKGDTLSLQSGTRDMVEMITYWYKKPCYLFAAGFYEPAIGALISKLFSPQTGLHYKAQACQKMVEWSGRKAGCNVPQAALAITC